jgi:PadR family transcriptional regulator
MVDGWPHSHRLSMGLDWKAPVDPSFPSFADGETMALTNQPPDLLPGTLDMLILRALTRGAMHGYGIAERLRQVSEDVLQVGESSLYPALQRLLLNGWVKAAWGASENNRRARYYTLTAAGKKRLESERQEFQKLVVAIQRVLEGA